MAKCEHPACTCNAVTASGFCSDECEESTNESGTCECGHVACAGAAAEEGGEPAEI